jgi:folate-binding protein YgfZ
MTVPYFYKNSNSRFLSIEGGDSNEFLQNLITNDINKCSEENILYSCLLSPQGKFLSDFFIFKKNEKYLIETHSFFYNKLLTKLKMYKLRSKVHINEINNLHSYSVFGDLKKDQDTFIFKIDPRNSNIGLKLIHLKKNPKILNSLNEINEEKYHQILIKNIVPLSHYDLEENKSLLLENNFENLNSISWDKGCYVGQEITARMKYRALLKKKIYSLEIKDGSAIIGQIIKDNESEFGKIISIKNNIMLAMLKIELAEKKINTIKQIKTNEGLVLEFIL